MIRNKNKKQGSEHRRTRYFQLYALLIFLLAGLPLASHAQGKASELFQKFKQQVFQIRVIDIASGDKNSIGSGFQVSKEGHLATNFHVVSSFVHKPEKYRLEYVAHDGSTGDIALLDFDVIHDLAVLKIAPLQKKYFRFNLGALSKGERIFSMGNPLDISMLIIEGNFNGLIQESRYRKILFSGSLNPGMSGGPAFDDHGRLVGINVAKGGEQISFLVPAARLHALYKRVRKHGAAKDFAEKIRTALFDDQQKFYAQLLDKQWESEALGDVLISGKMDKSLKCWGHTIDKKDTYYKGVHKHCRSQDRIFVSRRMHIGMFSYDYEWLTTDRLNRFQFYSQVESRFSHSSVSSVSRKEDATNYLCKEKFVEISQHSWKVSTCLRAYKKYQGLYDVLLMMTTVDQNDRALLAKAAMSGVSKENSVRFMKRFMEAIQWKP
ncbi:MAG: serine protease [Gammaproteobacteria bacterium]